MLIWMTKHLSVEMRVKSQIGRRVGLWVQVLFTLILRIRRAVHRLSRHDKGILLTDIPVPYFILLVRKEGHTKPFSAERGSMGAARSGRVLLRCAKWIRLLGKNHSAPPPTLSLNKIKNLKKRHIFLI